MFSFLLFQDNETCFTDTPGLPLTITGSLFEGCNSVHSNKQRDASNMTDLFQQQFVGTNGKQDSTEKGFFWQESVPFFAD